MKSLARKTSAVQKDYLKLVRQFPLRPIFSREEHRLALDIAGELSAKGDAKLSDGEVDYLAALARFIEDFEQKHILHSLGRSTPLEVLRHLMEEHDMGISRLGDIIGSRPAASMILKEQREMSKAHIRAIASYFHVNASLLI